ncbi:hypothetical protein ES708_33711 [subsurface metagenome]
MDKKIFCHPKRSQSETESRSATKEIQPRDRDDQAEGEDTKTSKEPNQEVEYEKKILRKDFDCFWENRE